jgi:hypothetical protein
VGKTTLYTRTRLSPTLPVRNVIPEKNIYWILRERAEVLELRIESEQSQCQNFSSPTCKKNVIKI